MNETELENNKHNKDPDATLDYHWNWTRWLTGDDTIDTAEITVSDGLTISTAMSKTDTTVTVWLSGGVVGAVEEARCRMTTVQGRTDDRTKYITILQR